MLLAMFHIYICQQYVIIVDGNNVVEVFHAEVFHLNGSILGRTRLLLAGVLPQVRLFTIETLDHKIVSHSI